MSHTRLVSITVALALVSTLANGYDPAPMQDFCVAVSDTELAVAVNGKYCKNPNLVTAQDFFFPGLLVRRAKNYIIFQTELITATVKDLPGLNTMGLSMARTDFGPMINPSHYHPRASEILVVVESTFHVGFFTSDPENRLIEKILEPGDTFVFPKGLVHFQQNIGGKNGLTISAYSSQDPGFVTLAKPVTDVQVIADLQAKNCEGHDCNDQKTYYDEL